jgi:hypothetical protein
MPYQSNNFFSESSTRVLSKMYTLPRLPNIPPHYPNEWPQFGDYDEAQIDLRIKFVLENKLMSQEDLFGSLAQTDNVKRKLYNDYFN